MSDESSTTAYNARAFADACEEIYSLKAVIESQKEYIERLKEDSGRKETEENLTAQLRDAWKECDQARAKVEKLERIWQLGAAYMEPSTLTAKNRTEREIAFVEALAAYKPDVSCKGTTWPDGEWCGEPKEVKP